MLDIELRLSVLKDLQKFIVQFCDDIREKSEEYNRREYRQVLEYLGTVAWEWNEDEI